MARKKIQLATDQRPFIIIYQDFLESNLLDNYYQRLVFIYLKKFANSNNQCYPSVKKLSTLSGISVNKIKITLKELEEKGVISIANRSRPDGGKSSNLYTLYDFKDLWNADSMEDVAAIIDEIEEREMIKALTAKGYYISKEKEPDSALWPVQNQASNYDNNIGNDTTVVSKSQDRYTMDAIKELFDYAVLMADYPDQKEDWDTTFSILYETMNSTKKTIRISGEDKPQEIVAAKLAKLTYYDIRYAVTKFHEQDKVIKNTKSYLLTILYNAREQSYLDLMNLGHRNGSF